MNARRALVVGITCLLTGCINKDEKIVDLSAAVFIVFLILVAFKQALPLVADIQFFQRFSKILQQVVPLIVNPLYAIALVLVLTGFFLSGIHEVLIFVGFVVGVLAVFLRRYSAQEAQEDKKRALETIFLALGVLTVMLLLWIVGTDLFNDL